MDYKFKTEPLPHQREVFDLSKDMANFGLVMPQGTGKTKVTMDTMGYNYARGRIEAAVVIVPSGLQRNWLEKELGKHWPDHLPVQTFGWESTPTTKKAKAEMEALFDPAPGERFRLVAIHYEGTLTEPGKKFLWRLFRNFATMVAVDESQYIKTPGAKRTRLVRNAGKAKGVVMKRFLTGTPITQGPFDIYAPFAFLDPNIIGHSTFTAFKAHYGEFETKVFAGCGRYDPRTGIRHDAVVNEVVGYKNMDELESAVGPYSYSVDKAVLNLPEKVYKTRYVKMTPKQRRVYNDLLNEGVANLGDLPPGTTPEDALWEAITQEGDKVLAENALVLQMRLQQIVGGWYVNEQGEAVPVDTKNPRLEALLTDLEHQHEKAVIWCRFKHEADAILAALNERAKTTGRGAVGYYGNIPEEERWPNAVAFQECDPRAFYMVATPDTAGRGLDFYKAGSSRYYSRSFNYEHRSQSEDRMHRHGFEGDSALYVDYCVPGTIDEKITDALQIKDNLAKSFQWGVGLNPRTQEGDNK